MWLVGIFRAKIVDISEHSLTIEVMAWELLPVALLTYKIIVALILNFYITDGVSLFCSKVGENCNYMM